MPDAALLRPLNPNQMCCSVTTSSAQTRDMKAPAFAQPADVDMAESGLTSDHLRQLVDTLRSEAAQLDNEAEKRLALGLAEDADDADADSSPTKVARLFTRANDLVGVITGTMARTAQLYDSVDHLIKGEVAAG
jgi:hypothetical protein